jgi:[FeFe] hydrogenase H-cluster maturation GTPase HydF
VIEYGYYWKEGVVMDHETTMSSLHIAILGRPNSGKSSLMNALLNREASTVSSQSGTTTETVHERLELPELGMVTLMDTRGFPDMGTAETASENDLFRVLDQTDLALVLFQNEMHIHTEKWWITELKRREIPAIGVITRTDECYIDEEPIIEQCHIPVVKVSSKNGRNIGNLRQAILEHAPMYYEKSTIVGDLLSPKSLVLMVVPSGRNYAGGTMESAQVQIARDVFQHHSILALATIEELRDIRKVLKREPDLVITETDLLEQVIPLLPHQARLMTVELLMARYKGELEVFLQGMEVAASLRPGARVLIAEACASHLLESDRIWQELPDWLKRLAGGELEFSVWTEPELPTDLRRYDLVLHCAACKLNRKQLMARVHRAIEQKIPITCFGVAACKMCSKQNRISFQADSNYK